jgi:hypothetical protein
MMGYLYYMYFYCGQIYHIYVDLFMLSSNNVCLSYKIYLSYITYESLLYACLSTTCSVLTLSISLLNQTMYGAALFYFIRLPNKQQNTSVLTFKNKFLISPYKKFKFLMNSSTSFLFFFPYSSTFIQFKM